MLVCGCWECDKIIGERQILFSVKILHFSSKKLSLVTGALCTGFNRGGCMKKWNTFFVLANYCVVFCLLIICGEGVIFDG